MTEATNLDVFNAALAMVGVETVARVRDSTAPAIACRLHYSAAYNRALTRVPWGFAHKKVELAKSADTDTSPLRRSSHIYDTPSDFERLWTWWGSITPEESGTVQEGIHIRSSCEPPLPLSYIAKTPLKNTSETFVELLEWILASLIKSRFPKAMVSAEGYSQNHIDAMVERIANEASVIELTQIHQEPRALATDAGRRRSRPARATSRYGSRGRYGR